MHELRELRSLAVESWNATQDDKCNMRVMFQELLANSNRNNNRSGSHYLDLSALVSSAEATMARYLPSKSSCLRAQLSKPNISTLLHLPLGTQLPLFHLIFAVVSAVAVQSTSFDLAQCEQTQLPSERFHRNYNIKFNRRQHEQSHRRDSPYGQLPRPPGSPPAFDRSATPSAGRGAHRNQPTWMKQQLHSRTGGPSAANHDNEPTPSPPKRTRNCTLFVRSCQHQVNTSPALRPMPLRVDNGLPHVHYAKCTCFVLRVMIIMN